MRTSYRVVSLETWGCGVAVDRIFRHVTAKVGTLGILAEPVFGVVKADRALRKCLLGGIVGVGTNKVSCLGQE